MNLVMVNLASSLLKKLIKKINNICISSVVILLLMTAIFILGMVYLVGIEGRDILEQMFFG